MATVVNDRDVLILAAVPRYTQANDRGMFVTPSASVFKVAANGSASPASVTLQATLLNLVGTVAWSWSAGLAPDVSGNALTLDYSDFSAVSGTITATITVDGETFTQVATITKVADGASGATTYTWVKYADSAAGAGLSDDPTGKAYIGFAYNKATATESTVATDYTWSLIKGKDGVQGDPGENGATLYTWIKYSDAADGTGLYDTPTSSTLYIGIAVNKSTATESTVKTDYVWSRFRGDQGVPGESITGPRGIRGNVDIAAVTAGSVWSDSEAVAALSAAGYGAPQVRDLVKLYKADKTFSIQKMYNGSAWVAVDYVYDGSVFVKGSILPEAVDTRGLTIRDAAGNVILDAGKTLASQTASNPNRVSRLSDWPGRQGNAYDSVDTTYAVNGEVAVLPSATGNTLRMFSSRPLGIPDLAWYTVSFWVIGQGAATAYVDVQGGSVDTVGKTVSVTTTATRYEFTEQMPSSATGAEVLRLFATAAGARVHFWDVKIELGKAATAWCDNQITASTASTFIADAAILAAQIANAAITTAKIADAAIQTAKIGDAQITGAKIVDATIGTAKIGDAAITAAKISDAAITNAKIGTAAVDTLTIAGNAVTVMSSASGTYSAQITVLTHGAPIYLSAAGTGVWAGAGDSAPVSLNLQIARDGTALRNFVQAGNKSDTAGLSLCCAGVYVDYPPAGTHTYTFNVTGSMTSATVDAGLLEARR